MKFRLFLKKRYRCIVSLAGLFLLHGLIGQRIPPQSPLQKASFDVTIVGPVCFADGIGRQAIGCIDCLKDVARVNFIHTRDQQYLNLQDIPQEIQNIITHTKPGIGKVVIFEDVLSNGNPVQPEYYYTKIPKNSAIKLAYTMFESTRIPEEWVAILNNNFDAALVPDEWLVEVYKDSGVTIPVFVLPLGIYIEKLLAVPRKHHTNAPFTFGFSGAFTDRKNHRMILEAFAAAFQNSPHVRLKLHGRSGNELYNTLRNRIQELGLTNVDLICKAFTEQEYNEFMTSLDCYVSCSKGEGFAIPPREALALGIPCILTNHSAHKTLCDSGFVYAIPAALTLPAYYDHLQQVVGDNFNCTLADAQRALLNVYHNYAYYLQQANVAREWVKQYLYQNLKEQYLSFVKPKKIILGPVNKSKDGYLSTNCPKLFKKYKTLQKIKESGRCTVVELNTNEQPAAPRDELDSLKVAYAALQPLDQQVTDVDIIGAYRVMTGKPMPFYDYVHFKHMKDTYHFTLTHLAHHILAMLVTQQHLQLPSLNSVADIPIKLKNGMTLFGFESDLFIARSIERDGYWEPLLEQLIRKVVKPGDYTLDIGANIGYFTAILAECVGNGGRVYAVEGLSYLSSLLEKAKAYNHWNQVTVAPYLVSDKRDELFFLINSVNPGGSCIVSSEEAQTMSKLRPQSIIKVPSISLDELILNHYKLPRIDYIKMDVEGAEYSVIQGALSMIKRFAPKISMEFSPARYRQQGIDPVAFLEGLVQQGYHFDLIETVVRKKDPVDYLKHHTRNPAEFVQLIESQNWGHVDIFLVSVT